jgi:integrase
VGVVGHSLIEGMKPLTPGIRRHGAGWQTSVQFRGDRLFEQWPLDADAREMRDWIEDKRAELRLLAKARPSAGSFESDARKYLRRPDIKGLTTYAERMQHIDEWIRVFGNRRRRSVTPELIEAQRDAWLTEGFSGASVNKRLRALSNLWTKLDGRRAPNPVREVSECEETAPTARGLPYDVIEAILDAVPEVHEGKTKAGVFTRGKGIARPSQTKARLRVIAYTGLSHSQIKALTPSDVDLEAGTVRVIARRKGRKVQRAHQQPLPELLPLSSEHAVDAFRRFAELNCWGEFSNSSMWKSFRRACNRIGLTGLKPYDFRHSFLSMVYQETKDLRVTGTFGGHRSERTTLRYTMAAVAPHVLDAAAKVRARLASPGTHAKGIKRA